MLGQGGGGVGGKKHQAGRDVLVNPVSLNPLNIP